MGNGSSAELTAGAEAVRSVSGGTMTAFKPEVEIICPFCNGTAFLGFEGAMHAQPACTTFLELEADAYVHEVYEFVQKTKDPGAQVS
jgi:hypothetical protein